MDQKIGTNPSVDVSFDPSKGTAQIAFSYVEAWGTTSVSQAVNARMILDAIAKLGTVEAEIIGVLEAALLPAQAAAPSA